MGELTPKLQIELLRVFRFTHWRIEGANGAAMILDMNPSTLRSRMRKLGIQKP